MINLKVNVVRPSSVVSGLAFLESFNGDTSTEEGKLTDKENLGIGTYTQKTFQNDPNKDKK